MENACISIKANNEQTFKNLISDKNRERFFREFIDEDDSVEYIISDIGELLKMNKKQLLTMLQTSDVCYEIVDTYTESCKLVLNGLPMTIEYR